MRGYVSPPPAIRMARTCRIGRVTMRTAIATSNSATSFASATPGAPRKWISSTPTSTLSESLHVSKQIQDGAPVAIRFQLRQLGDLISHPVLHLRGRRSHFGREARFGDRGGHLA